MWEVAPDKSTERRDEVKLCAWCINEWASADQRLWGTFEMHDQETPERTSIAAWEVDKVQAFLWEYKTCDGDVEGCPVSFYNFSNERLAMRAVTAVKGTPACWAHTVSYIWQR